MKGPGNSTLIRAGAWCLAAAALGCGGTDPPENRAPVAVGSIPALNINEREEVSTSVAAFFDDADGDTLIYAAQSSATGVVTAAMAKDTITVMALEEGTATITVTATDPDDESAMQTAAVTVLDVNRTPVVEAAIGNRTLQVGAADTLLLSDHFSDPDGDTLSYAAASDDEEVAATELDGAELLIRGVRAGTAAITVMATDPKGASVSQMATVTIEQPNRAPVVRNPIDSLTWTVGTGLTLLVSNHFSDPDGDPLTYEAETTDEDIVEVDLYDGELEMFGVEVGVAIVTITATDPDGLSATMSITATIVEG